MKLVFYSGGTAKDNLSLDKAFIDLIGKKNPVITFIPSSSYLSDQEFKVFVKHYSQFKISRFIHFPVDIPFDQVLFKEVIKSDGIHLGGGNTFYFLNSLRKAKVLNPLRDFVMRGGVLSGLSAGAILMTENIELAGYPEFDRDENSVGLKNLSALGLVDFGFFPHYRNSLRYEIAFQNYSRLKKKVVFACPDGSGMVKVGNEIRFIGRTIGFHQGKKFSLN
jgi:dipeptidase E